MEVREMLKRVERFWPFDDQSYPGYSQRSDTDKKVFAIGHVAKHLAKAVRIGDEAKELQAGCSPDEFSEMLSKLVFDTLRLALLIEVPVASVEKALSEWDLKTDPMTSGHFGMARASQKFFWQHGRINAEVLRVLELIEPCDHGDPVPYGALHTSSENLILAVTRLANIFRYPRRDFERLLSRDRPGPALFAA